MSVTPKSKTGNVLSRLLPRAMKADQEQEMKEEMGDISAGLEEALAEGADSEEDDSDEEEPTVTAAKVKEAVLSPAKSVAEARARLDEEDRVFHERKMTRKSEKIKLGKTEEKKEKKPKKGLFDSIMPGKKDKPEKTKEEKNAIDERQAAEKEYDEFGKYPDMGLNALSKAGKVDQKIPKAVGKLDQATATNDAIAIDAGVIDVSATAVATNLMEAYRSYKLYSKTGETAHRKAALKALGGSVAGLTNLTKGCLKVADHAGALDAGSVVPILGCVAKIPVLVAEINDLRSAMTRLAKQEKIREKLKDDPDQAALQIALKSFMATDGEAIVKGFTKVLLDFTNIAGHGVSAGGITAPVGVALTAVGSAGKLLLSGVGTVEDFKAAHDANDRRKKLEGKDDDEEWQGGQEETAHQRNARKLMQSDPRVAAQVVIDQALREGGPGGPASKILKSFGVKPEQVYKDLQGDAKTDNIRAMRQHMLYKLDAKDKEADTFKQTLVQGKKGVKDYLSMKTKNKELANYMEAKNLLMHGGNVKRDGKWQFKMTVLTGDVEEKKAELLEQVLIMEKSRKAENDKELEALRERKKTEDTQEVDDLLKKKEAEVAEMEKVLTEVKRLLKPRKEKGGGDDDDGS